VLLEERISKPIGFTLSLSEAASLLRLSESALIKLTEEGKIPHLFDATGQLSFNLITLALWCQLESKDSIFMRVPAKESPKTNKPVL
jgi:hypothetical protein